MTDPAKLARLTQRLACMASRLARHHDLAIHQRISESYYLQKIEEMKLLLNLLEESQGRLETVANLASERYREIFHQWRKDIRWLNTYLQNREDYGTIL